MKYLICCIIFSLCIFSRGGSQDLVFPLKNYTNNDYGRVENPTNWAISQDQRGIIYAANGFKLLEFDGNSWKSYPINKEVQILSLAIDRAGIIYIGSLNEFGYFMPDSRGKLKYCSLSDSLEIIDTDFTNVWKVHAYSGGVFFQSEDKLFLYRKGKTEVIKPETSFHTSFLVNDILYVRQREKGLSKWNGTNLVQIKGSEIFDTTGIFLMLPFRRNNEKILIGTQEKGFWIFDTQNAISPFRAFKVENPSLFEKARIMGGVLTGDGEFAVSTMLNGVIVIDTTGKTKQVINKKYGLTENEVKQVISDQDRNLWLALINGISSVEISSPLIVYKEKSGITGDIRALNRYNNQLYIGTSTGLFIYKPDNYSESQFVPAFIQSSVRCLVKADGSLFAGTDEGLFQITGRNLKVLDKDPSYTLFYSPDLKLLFSGGQKGVTVYRNNGSLRKLDFLKEIRNDIIGITGIPYNNSDSLELWIGTRNDGVLRIKVHNDLTFTADHYKSADGLPGGAVTPYISDSKAIFGTTVGLFEFINESIARETLPDSLKNNKDFLRGYFSIPTDSTRNIRKPVSHLVENKNRIWICSDNMIGYLNKSDNLKFISQPFLGIEVGKINTIYPEDNGICWFGTTDGLIRYNENVNKNYNTVYNCLIRKVILMGEDSTIFFGTNFEKDPSLRISLTQPAALKPVIPYRKNSLRIEFTAPFYEYQGKISYSFQLEGGDSKWTQWSNENYKEFTNLREGEYAFRVKARNVYGVESTEAYYSFTILPPWYRTIAAYIFYVVAALIIIWFTARIYSYRLKLENIRLEGIVVERTAEVVKQKDEIENKNVVLEYQKKEIEDSIRYASRIQSAVIPSEKDCLELLPESFVFFRPLNIVSGDFYWIGKVQDKIIFTAVDCTGHGVPGAIMSMLGIAFLNEIVNKDCIVEPHIILNNLRNKVIDALQQQGISGEARDGMDIAIVCLDEEGKMLRFAGANNPLRLIRNGEIIEFPGDKMPIGFYEKMTSFTLHEVKLEKGDVFYMASDGYEDQFGGPDGKKFKSKKFKELLLEIHKHPMSEQKDIIEKRFYDWKGDLNQIDDVVVTGFAIK